MLDLSVIFRLRTKKLWWVDVLYYFAISLLVSTVLCYLIFLTKNYFQRRAIENEIAALQTVGTEQQKKSEEEVITYQKKINDFVGLFNNHEFASNAFAFMQTQTMPNIWFGQFVLDKKASSVQLTGEADSLEIFGRQVAGFEKNKYVRDLGGLNSSLSGTRVQFSMNLSLDKSIFSYISEMTPILEAAALAEEEAAAKAKEETATEEVTGEEATAGEEGTVIAPNTEKMMIAFHLLTEPEVIGVVDQTNYTVTLDVPFGTDVKNLKTSIDLSPKATVEPAADVAQDFTNPVTYKVIAEDGATQDYKVSVNVLPEVVSSETSGKSGSGVWIAVIITIIILIIIAVVVFFAWRRMKNKKRIPNVPPIKPSI